MRRLGMEISWGFGMTYGDFRDSDLGNLVFSKTGDDVGTILCGFISLGVISWCYMLADPMSMRLCKFVVFWG